MKIDKQNGNVAFCDSSHKYWDVTDPNKKYVSVTTLIHSYAQDFDASFWSAYKALEQLVPKESWAIEKKSLLNTHRIDLKILDIYNIKESDFNKAQQDILDEWERKKNESCERGTNIHAQLENSFYGDKTRQNTLKKLGIGGKFECKKNFNELILDKAIYPEYLISRDSNDGYLHLAGQIDVLVKDGNSITIIDWKGLPLDTPILTSNGWSTMKDLKVGDKVFDKDGKLCNVIVKSEIHHNPCYKIKFSTNFEITADCDHRWLVYFKTHPNTKYCGKPREEILTTKEIYNLIKSLTKSQLKNGYNIPRIKIAQPLVTEEKKLPLDPYILGLWLGDGDTSCGKITQELNAKSWDYITQHGFKISPNYEKRENVKAETRVVYGLMPILRTIGVLNNKHIPDIYMTASYNQRLDLLRGLMDSDGYYDHTHKQYCTQTTHLWQAEGVLALISSLGVKATFNMFKITNGYKPVTAYDIKFMTTNFNAFMCRNQNIELKDNSKNYWSVQNIEPVETIPTQCIAVDSPSNTYLCTKYLLITHNTNEEIKVKGTYNSKTKGVTTMKYPLNNIQDCNYNHYQLQLSTYAWMLQKINPNFEIKDLILYHFDHKGNETLYHCKYLKKEVERMLIDYKKKLIHEDQINKRKRIDY